MNIVLYDKQLLQHLPCHSFERIQIAYCNITSSFRRLSRSLYAPDATEFRGTGSEFSRHRRSANARTLLRYPSIFLNTTPAFKSHSRGVLSYELVTIHRLIRSKKYGAWCELRHLTGCRWCGAWSRWTFEGLWVSFPRLQMYTLVGHEPRSPPHSIMVATRILTAITCTFLYTPCASAHPHPTRIPLHPFCEVQ
ncbi:hypothetical protein BDR05DRAFT_751819 [Suillus weaverae]|nr:hypothetical protein BDR05DRAFT_751819 [Suillus weaverae]